MPHSSEQTHRGQEDTCDCLLCGIRRVLQAKHPAPLTPEAHQDIIKALAYCTGVALQSSREDLSPLFCDTVDKAIADTAAAQRGRATSH